MFTKRIVSLIAAGFVLFGIAGFAEAQGKGYQGQGGSGGWIMAQDQTRDRLQDGSNNGVPDQTRDRLKDGTVAPDRTQDRLQDGSCNGVPAQLRDHDRIGAGAGGMGGGMRGPRR